MLFSSSTKGHLITLMTVFVWGITYVATKVLLTEFKPIEILFFRFTLGYATLWLLSPRFFAWQGIKQELMFLGAGFCGVTCYFLCENIALTYTTASNVGVITTLAPVFTAILAIFFLKTEKPAKSFYIGCLFSMIGIVLITLNGKFVLSVNPLGDLLAVFACLFWACYSILTKRSSNYGYNIILLTRRFFFYGLIFMLPALYLFDFEWNFSRFNRPVNLLNILFLGVGASAICFASWNYAVKLVGAVKISIYIYLVPILTIINAVLILDEPFTWIAAIGTLFTLGGVLLSEGKIKLKKH
ncbi:EamA family transporter [Gilliamella apicola]|uniref:DMT family transporter n=1 Tax=Gilliamella apicola TaxID=1196095 RepID=A0A556SWJ6_9GAMM|nr:MULTISPECIES: DMT family transporter [Gilliamella]MBI0093855.1 DMT family transporter [Gilliamella sp. W8136]OTP98896.1 EamA family transporter [Gilliamella apicola]OTQ24798.1 EamA family transporter [Gilliamella apicola]TSK05519.1 DMT family transporter [Gilliamella apicola]